MEGVPSILVEFHRERALVDKQIEPMFCGYEDALVGTPRIWRSCLSALCRLLLAGVRISAPFRYRSSISEPAEDSKNERKREREKKNRKKAERGRKESRNVIAGIVTGAIVQAALKLIWVDLLSVISGCPRAANPYSSMWVMYDLSNHRCSIHCSPRSLSNVIYHYYYDKSE